MGGGCVVLKVKNILGAILVGLKINLLLVSLIAGPICYANEQANGILKPAQPHGINSTPQLNSGNPSLDTKALDDKESLVHIEQNPFTDEKSKRLYGKTLPAWGTKSAANGDFIDENEIAEMVISYITMFASVITMGFIPAMCPTFLIATSILALVLGSFLILSSVIVSVALYKKLVTTEVNLDLRKENLDKQKLVIEDMAVQVKNYMASVEVIKNIAIAGFAVFVVAMALAILETILTKVPLVAAYFENINATIKAAKLSCVATLDNNNLDFVKNKKYFLSLILEHIIKFTYASQTPTSASNLTQADTSSSSVPQGQNPLGQNSDNLPSSYKTDYIKNDDFKNSSKETGQLAVAGALLATSLGGAAAAIAMRKALHKAYTFIIDQPAYRIGVAAVFSLFTGLNAFLFLPKKLETMQKRKDKLLAISKDLDTIIHKSNLNTQRMALDMNATMPTDPKKIDSGTNLSENNCFTLGAGMPAQIDRNCDCKLTNSCGVAAFKVEKIGDIKLGQGAVDGLKQGTEYANKLSSGDPSAYNSVNTNNMAKLATKMTNLSNDLLDQVDKNAKDKKQPALNLPDQVNSLYQNVNAAVKKALADQGIDTKKLVQMSGLADSQNPLNQPDLDKKNDPSTNANPNNKNNPNNSSGNSQGSADSGTTPTDNGLNFSLDDKAGLDFNANSAMSKDELQNAYGNLDQKDMPEQMGEIVTDDGVNLFEILSNRYKRKYEFLLGD